MTPITEQCRGKWQSILPHFGVPPKYLSGRHTPCPFCQGTDRFRFDDREGRGTYICSHCGAGDGFTMVMRLRGCDFVEARKLVEPLAGGAERTVSRQQRSQEQLRKMMEGLWNSGHPVRYGDPVSQYLEGRGIEDIPDNVRYVEKCRCNLDAGPVWLPAMIALVQAPDGTMSSVHRTYLGETGKANIPEPRKLMPGRVAKGSAIRLFPQRSEMGIAEGIETAMSASKIFRMPVWSSINAGMLMAFEPPAEVRSLYILGDNDVQYGGQSAAYALAHRLSCSPTGPRSIIVRVPSNVGEDWNDVMSNHRTRSASLQPDKDALSEWVPARSWAGK